MAFPQDWANGRVCELVIDQVGSSLASFPLILTAASLPSEMLDSNNANAALDGGGDIRFSSDRAGAQQLACDVRAFHPTAGGTGAYADIAVKVTLSGTGTTTIYIWYKAVGQTQPAVSDTYGQHNAYDVNFMGVWPLNQDPGPGGAGDILDRTSNARHLTAHANMASDDLVDGQVYKAIRIANTEYLEGASITFPQIRTLELLIKPSAFNLLDTVIRANVQGLGLAASPNELRDGYDWSTATGLTLTADVWAYVAQRADAAEKVLIRNLDTFTTTVALAADAGVLRLGGTSGGAGWYNGQIDETRVSSVKRTADWCAATYQNLINPGTFLAVGTPEAASQPYTYDARWRQFDMGARQINTTNYPIVFPMVDSTDGITGETGLTPVVTISKNGGAFGAAAGAVVEVGNGLYRLEGNATDRNTLGELAIHATGTGAKPFDAKLYIVTHNPFDIATGNATLTMQQTIDGKLDDIMGPGFVVASHALDQVADVASIIDANYDEDIVSAHGSANSAGFILRKLGAEISARTNNSDLNDLLGVPDQVGATVVTEAGGGGGGGTSPQLLISTSLATVPSQTSMTLTSGSSDNDAYKNCLAVFTDQSVTNQKAAIRITAYVGSTRTITLERAAAFVLVVGDSISIIAEDNAPLSSGTIQTLEDAILEDNATLRTTANSVGRALNTLTAIGARTNNANVNSLLGVADQAGLTVTTSRYFARFQFVKDDAASRDEYRCIRWYRDDTPLDAGVSGATIRVINADTGADLIPETSVSEAGSSHLFSYTATSGERIVPGQAYAVRLKATINSQVRVFEGYVARDVTS